MRTPTLEETSESGRGSAGVPDESFQSPTTPMPPTPPVMLITQASQATGTSYPSPQSTKSSNAYPDQAALEGFAPANPPVPVAAEGHVGRVVLWIVVGILGLLVLMAVAAVLLFWPATTETGPSRTVPVGELRTETQSVPVGSAQSVTVDMKKRGGTLTIDGGAPDSLTGSGRDLLNATFTYNVGDWKPEVKYAESGNTGTLTIHQSNWDKEADSPEKSRNEWQLLLRNNAPLSLVADLGGGKTDLTLGGLDLRNLELRTIAGATTVDLRGDWKHDLSATIDSGAGLTTLRLPTSTGVRVTTQGLISKVTANGMQQQGNSYTNDAYGKSPVTLNIDVTLGVGSIVLNAHEP